jgi:hypothetical protein
MIEFLGFYQQQRPLRDTLHLSLDASLYQQDYLQLNNYDVGLIRVGGVIARDISPDWQWQGDSHISNTFIAGSSSSRTLSLQGGLHRQLAGVRSGIDIQITRIEAQDIAYDQLTGWQYELITRHSGRQADWKYDLGAQFAINDRADYLTATRFSSYSPRRLTLSGKIQAPLTSRLDGALKLDWRHSRYRDADLLADSSLLRREEQRWRLTADLKHPLNRDTDLRLQYRYSRNESNLTGYDYRRNQIQLGVMFSW